MPKTTGNVSLVASYGPKEVVPLAPPLCFAAQGPPPGIPIDSTLKVISQLELMNLKDSSSITDVMQAIWSTDLAKNYQHLLWVLFNKPFEVEALTAADVVLSAPAALWILGPEVA
uniref:Uncharacterized protein n=1 Tax=Romanomermis culicivorax TaxID=13658 RepID=A0A915K9N9_ROMCU